MEAAATGIEAPRPGAPRPPPPSHPGLGGPSRSPAGSRTGGAELGGRRGLAPRPRWCCSAPGRDRRAISGPRPRDWHRPSGRSVPPGPPRPDGTAGTGRQGRPAGGWLPGSGKSSRTGAGESRWITAEAPPATPAASRTAHPCGTGPGPGSAGCPSPPAVGRQTGPAGVGQKGDQPAAPPTSTLPRRCTSSRWTPAQLPRSAARHQKRAARWVLAPGAGPEAARARSKAHRDRGRPADRRPGMGEVRTVGRPAPPAPPCPGRGWPPATTRPPCPGRGWPQDSRRPPCPGRDWPPATPLPPRPGRDSPPASRDLG